MKGLLSLFVIFILVQGSQVKAQEYTESLIQVQAKLVACLSWKENLQTDPVFQLIESEAQRYEGDEEEKEAIADMLAAFKTFNSKLCDVIEARVEYEQGVIDGNKDTGEPFTSSLEDEIMLLVEEVEAEMSQDLPKSIGQEESVANTILGLLTRTAHRMGSFLSSELY